MKKHLLFVIGIIALSIFSIILYNVFSQPLQEKQLSNTESFLIPVKKSTKKSFKTIAQKNEKKFSENVNKFSDKAQKLMHKVKKHLSF